MSERLHAFRLDGKVAVITGAARGIGLEIGRWFADAGARVILTDSDAAEGARAAPEIANARFMALDLTDRGAIPAVLNQIRAANGRLDILVNNAGTGARKASTEIALEDWDRVLAVNLTGAFIAAREAAKIMLAGSGGAIVNIASIMGLVGNDLFANPAYHATKGALVNLTRAHAAEWAPRIRVNAIAPTFVKTALTEKLLSHELVAKGILAKTPMKDFATPADVAAAALFLASDAARMTTGHVLAVDGGWLAI